MLQDNHKYFALSMKIKFLYFYLKNIRTPLQKKLQEDQKEYDRKKHYEQLLAMTDYDPEEIKKLKIEAFKEISSYQNHQLEEF